MRPTDTEGRGGRAVPLRLLALMVSIFCIGTAELLPGGVLPQLADDLDVSISSAGLLVTFYAVAMVVGGPLVTGLTMRLPRRRLLIALMVTFLAGSTLAALAPSYEVLVVARVVCALTQGTFVAVSIVVAAGMVAPEKAGTAVSTTVLGYNLATVLGVPVGTLVGQHFGWRTTFGAIAVLSVAGVALLAWLLPAGAADPTASVRREIRVFASRGVLLSIVVTVLATGGMFTLITYMVPVLTDVSGVSSTAVPVLLVVYGLGSLAGNMIGGRLADRSLLPSLVASLGALTAACLLFGLLGPVRPLAVVMVLVFALATFVVVPVLQTYTLHQAADAPALSVTVNMSAFGLGAAIGSWYGGTVIDSSFGVGGVAVASAVLTGAAGLVALALYLTSRRAPRTSPGADRPPAGASTPGGAVAPGESGPVSEELAVGGGGR